MRDPLRNRWVAVILVLVLVAVFAEALQESISAGTPTDLPGVALQSPAILHLVRAVVATALIAGLAVVLIRGAFGQWPLEVSTTGVKYAEVVESESELAEHVRDVVAATKAIDARLSAVENPGA